MYRNILLAVVLLNTAWGEGLVLLDQLSSDVFPTLNGAATVAVAPDGKHVYVGTDDIVDGTGITWLVRDKRAGTLAYAGNVSAPHGMMVSSLAIAPGGRHVYASSWQAILTFTRDTLTGTLSSGQADTLRVSGEPIFGETNDVTLSPDGLGVYVTEEFGLWAFHRDPSTGRLALVGQWGSGNGGIASINAAKSSAVSPDGRHLYVATFDGVLLFERNAATSALTLVKKYVDSPAEDGLTFGWKILVSPDGSCVYLTGFDESTGTISWFARNPVSGEIQYAGQFSGNGQSVIDWPRGLAVSSDSRHLFLSAGMSSPLIWFRRDKATCSAICNDIASTDTLGNWRSVALSPDDAHVYVAGFRGLMVFGYDTNYIAKVSSPRVPGRLSSPAPTITWLNAGYLFVRASLPSSAAGKDCVIRLSSLDGRIRSENRASIGDGGFLRAKIVSPYPRAGNSMILCTIKAGRNSWTTKCVRLNRTEHGK